MTEKGRSNETSTDSLYLQVISQEQVLLCLSLIISLLGLLGNGFVVWFLCFQIKQKKFIIYFLNLAMADLLLLFSFFVLLVYLLLVVPGMEYSLKAFQNHTLPLQGFAVFGYFNGLFLLTAISVERCLSVQFPIWYHCQRPKRQSAIVCVLLWGLSCLLTMLDYAFCYFEAYFKGSWECTAVVITVVTFSFGVATPLMVFANLILVIKMCRRPQQRSPPKIYIIIVVSVFAFLVFVFPEQLWMFFIQLKVVRSDSSSFMKFFFWAVMCNCISSAVNPFMYFLVGSERKRGTKGFITGALQRVFREETETPKRKDEILASDAAQSIV